MVQTLLLPGLDGSAHPHWQNWWAQTDPTALVVEQQSWSRPRPDEWLFTIETAVARYPGAILVGHSLGAVAAVKLLNRNRQLNVAGLLLVAPAETGRDERIRCFGDIPERVLPVPAIVVASRNDPWMTFSRASVLAKVWGAGLIDMGEAGHINSDSGFGPWSEGKRLRNRLLPRGLHNHSQQAEHAASSFSQQGQTACRP